MRWRRDPNPEAGNAVLETVGLGVVLLLPCLYGVLAVFTVQSGVFATTEAARQAGRAIESSNSPDAPARARAAAALAVRDQGLPDDEAHLSVYYVVGGGSEDPGCDTDARRAEPPSQATIAGSRVVLCVEERVPVPYTDSSFLRGVAPTIPVRSGYPLTTEDFRG